MTPAYEDVVWMPSTDDFPAGGSAVHTTAVESTAITSYREFRQDAFALERRGFLPLTPLPAPYRLRVTY